jgi:hypothetical protein
MMHDDAHSWNIVRNHPGCRHGVGIEYLVSLTMIHQLYKLVLFLFSLSCIQGQESTSDVDTILEIMDWVRSNGGWINDKVEVRTIHGALSGIFATQDLVWGEVIAYIPWKLIIKVDKDDYTWCDSVENVRRFLINDNQNQTLYQRYLTQRSVGHIPRFWSNTSKDLLTNLVEGLSLNGFSKDPFDLWEENCGSPGDLWHVRATMLLETRGDGRDVDFLVPFGDLLNHRVSTMGSILFVEDLQ